MPKLKTISKIFIWGNIFDILITLFAVNNGAIELNIIVNHFGWLTVYIAKLLSTILTVYFLEKVNTRWFFWSLPVFIWLIVIWNALNTILILLDKIVWM